MTQEQGRKGDRCSECGGGWLVMVAHFDHRMTCSRFPQRLREKIERDRAFQKRLREDRERERSLTSQGEPGPPPQGRPKSADMDAGPEREPGPPTRTGVVVNLITGHVVGTDEDDHIDQELRGGNGGLHPLGHDCSLCEDQRRRILRRELRGIPGASPKREEGPEI